MTLPRRRTRGLGAAVAVTALAAAAAPAGAESTGATTIELRGAAAKALTSGGVRLTATKPAKAGAKRIVLPVASGTVGSGATLKHRGTVTLRARKGKRVKTAKLSAFQTRVTDSRATVTAKLGRSRVAFFTISAPARRVSLDATAGTAKVTGGSARLTPAGAKALRRSLGLRELAAGPLGAATLNARVERTGGGQPGQPTTPGTPGTPTNPNTPPPVDPRNPPVAPPIEREPDVLARPAGAVDVTGATVTWWIRDSWIAYLHGGNVAPATGVTPSDGAVAQAPVAPEQHVCPNDPKRVPPLTYAYSFAFKNGWYEPGTRTAGLYFGGKVRFEYRSHGIDFSAADPEIELTSSPRTIFRFDGGQNTRLGNKRGVLTRLDVARAQRTEVGRTITYGPILGTLAEGSTNSFADFYFPGDGYGCVEVSFTY